MFLMIDLFIFCAIMLFFNREWITVYDFLIVILVVLSSIVVDIHPAFTAMMFVYSVVILLLPVVLKGDSSKGIAIAIAYFISTAIAFTYFHSKPLWTIEYIYHMDVMFMVRTFVIKFIVFSIIMLVFMRPFFNYKKSLVFINRINLVIMAVCILIFLIYESLYANGFMEEDKLLFQLVFGIYVCLYVGSMMLAFSYYYRLNRKEIVQEELEQLYVELSGVATHEKVRVISELRKMAIGKRFEEITFYTEQFKNHDVKSDGNTGVLLLEDKYLRVVINDKVSRYPQVDFSISVTDFAFDNITATISDFLEVFVIILDNAFEAASKSCEKKVVLSFEENKISVSNSFNEMDYKAFISKTSNKGKASRMNGLKLLEELQATSDIVLVSYVDSLVHFDMTVIV